MRRTLTAIFACLALGLAGLGTLGAPAGAASASAVTDCNANGRLTAHYTAAQLKNALATMPADVKAYTDCYDVIQRALLAELGQLHGSGATRSGSGGSLLPTPVIIALVVLVLAAAGLGTMALRRRTGTGGAHPDD